MENIVETTSFNIDAIKSDTVYVPDDEKCEYTNEIQVYFKKIWGTNPIDFNSFSSIICGTNTGNFIAVMDTPSESRTIHTIKIYNFKFEIVNEIKIMETISKAAMHFTTNGHLFVITSHQNEAKLYEFFSRNKIKEISFEIDSDIRHCQMWDDGYCFVTQDNNVWYSERYERPELIFQISSSETLNCFAIVHPNSTGTAFPIVYAGAENNELIIANRETHFSLKVSSKIVYLSINPTNEYIIIGLEDGTIKAATADLKEVTFSTSYDKEMSLLYFGWLGNYVPLIAAREEICMIDRSGILSYFYVNGDPIIFNMPSNCALVFVNSDMLVLGEVDEGLDACFDKNNGAYRLCKSFDSRSFTQVAELTNESLPEAIGWCIKAAKELVFSVDYQKYFLSVAAFGINFIPSGFESPIIQNISSENFTIEDFDIPFAIKILRLENNMKEDLSIFVNYQAAYNLFMKGAAIMRYSSLNKFTKAIEIAEISGYKKSIAVTEWCRAVINTIDDQEEIIKIFTTKIDKGFSATDVAVIAKQIKGIDFAIKVAQLERYPQRIIPFLINEGMWEIALCAAMDSLDSSQLARVISQAFDAIGVDGVKEIVARNKDLYLMISSIAFNAKPRNKSKKDAEPDTVWEICAEMIKTVELNEDNMEVYIRHKLKSMTLPISEEMTSSFSNLDKDFPSPLTKHQLEALTSLKTIDTSIPVASKSSLNEVLVNTAMRSIKDAIKVGENAGFKEKRTIMIIARGLAKNEMWDKFNQFAQADYKDLYQYFVTLAYEQGGYTNAKLFVNEIPKEKIKAEFCEILERWQYSKNPESKNLGKSSLSSQTLFK